MQRYWPMVVVVGTVGVKLVFGTGMFLLIRQLARSKWNPARTAAGLMLTFPLLNGMGLVLTEQGTAADKLEPMLPMIAVNGALCLGYILCALRHRSANHAWVLCGVAIVVWALIALMGLAVPDGWQWQFIAAVALIAIWLAAGLRPERQGVVPDPPSKSRRDLPLLVFVVTLSTVLLLGNFAETSPLVGPMSALPVLPLLSLTAIAVDGRVQALQQMKFTALMGAVVAMSYAALLSGAVSESGLSYSVALMLAGWIVAAFVIFGSAWTYDRLAARVSAHPYPL